MDISFDFGSKQAAEGYIKITGRSLYNDEVGYGIAHRAQAMIRNSGEKEIMRDFLVMDQNSFKVKVPNGLYKIRIALGDYEDEGDVTTVFKINGEEKHSWVHDSTVIERFHEVEVRNGEILFEFSGKHPALNAIDIAAKRWLKMSEVSWSACAKPECPSITLTWPKVEGSHGYQILRKNLRNGEYDRLDNVYTERYTDTTVHLCKKYEYSVFPLYSNKFRGRNHTTVVAEVVDGGELKGDITELQAVSKGNHVTLLWESTYDAAFYNIFQTAPNGKMRPIGTTRECRFVDTEVDTTVPFTYTVIAVTPHGYSREYSVTSEVKAKPFRRKMETLDRSLVAVPTKDGVFLAWRLQAYEYKLGMSFVLFRNGLRITDVLDGATNYLDPDGKKGDTYTVKAVLNGKMEYGGYSTQVWDKEYLSIPLNKPEPFISPRGRVHEYTANDASVADLDGDGEYEIVFRWDANGKDNSHKGFSGSCIIDAYKLNGKQLWRIDLGKNIRAGQHYTQMMLYDFNNDGKAELICKTADGTVDGVGQVIGDPYADYRNEDGFVLEGREYLTMFNGETGAIMDTTDYDPPRGNVAEWGDSWGNRCDRYLACVAYLDGVNPSVVMCRGYYDHGRPTYLVAYDIIDNRFVKRWRFVADRTHNIEYTFQGNHNLGVADVDGDGKDEIIYGSMAVDHDGRGIYSTGLMHGDTINVGKFRPDGEGLDCFQIHEEAEAELGFELHDPATGEIKWGHFTGRDTTRGLCAKIDPRYPGNQCWVMNEQLFTIDGEVITENAPKSINFAIWWDGDLLRELLDCEFDEVIQCGRPKIYKWDYENEKLVTILDPKGTFSNNWRKGVPCLQASIIGDWREDVIWRNEDDTELRIYTTTDLTEHRIYTLMHDPVYRLSVAWQNTAYNQCTQTGFYIGPDMKEIPVPDHDYVRGEILPDFTEDIE
ncbi:MAG: rhamnogalacturonan lyase [Candidatus Ornithomonoglobus sp.]